MTDIKKIPPRDKIKTRDKWDLSPLFESDAAWRQQFDMLRKRVSEFEKFRGKLGTSPSVLRECYELNVEFEKDAEKVWNYAFLKSCEDVSDSTYQAMIAQVSHLVMVISEVTSFIAPEIRAIPRKKIAQFLESKELKPFRFELEKLLRYRPHILSRKEERLLAMQSEVSDAPGHIFGQLNDADLEFGAVTDSEGNRVELSQSTFRSLLESRDRTVRRKVFHKLYAAYEAHENTLSATLRASVLQDVYEARARNYPSALEAALFPERIPTTVYDNLIATVHDNLDTVYRYFDLRRRALGLRNIHFYDTYVPIVDTGTKRTAYPEAVKVVCEALQPLGSEYCETLERGLRGRWVDRYENKGKRSGAFSSGGYTGPPYILMNYKPETIDSMFTLAHEAGHSMHTYYSAANQPYQYYQYTIFVAEVASTLNELLLNNYLLDKAKSGKRRVFLISREIDEMRGTLVRQTMFAEFEKVIHAAAEAGEPITSEWIRAEYNKLLGLYFGPDFCLDDRLDFEVLRIPHFYSAFYVYKYATGIAAATALAQRILRGGQAERKRYIKFLESGGSDYPLELLKKAGVDMEKPEPINAAMAHFRDLVDELEDLLPV